MNATDFHISDHGSVCILYPNTPEACAWASDNLPDDCMRWGPLGVVIEPRYIGAIREGIINDGLTIN